MNVPVCHYGLYFLATVWVLLIAGGFVHWHRYETAPGKRGAAPAGWPRESRLIPEQDACNVVVAIHPHCPCSRSTLAALAEVLARTPGAVKVHALFCTPPAAPAGFERGDRWDQAGRLPRTDMLVDARGVEAERFGTHTSGHVVLFGKNGRILFSGGITAGRGQEGENPAREALRARLAGESTEYVQAVVYGCPLAEEESSGISTWNNPR